MHQIACKFSKMFWGDTSGPPFRARIQNGTYYPYQHFLPVTFNPGYKYMIYAHKINSDDGKDFLTSH